MYNEYFGFIEAPFSIAPDPRFLFMSEQHREALAHLLYGFNSNGGFVLLTGDVGTGKTTICRCLLENIPGKSSIAFIINPKLTVKELLATICDEFGIKYPEDTKSIKLFIDLINNYLLDIHSKGFKAVLIIDEAQNLSADVLEQLRLLTNLETNEKKLLQIILLGQPELRDKLAKQELRQLSQRIVARFHLKPLSKAEMHAYIKHRLSVAGVSKQLFSDSSINALYKRTNGVPRLINSVCDRALLGAFAQEKLTVNRTILKKAAAEVFGRDKNRKKSHFKKAAVWATIALVLTIFGAVVAKTIYKGNPVPINDVIADSKNDSSPVSNELDTVTLHAFNQISWPDHLPMKNSKEMAFKALFDQWNMTYYADRNSSACRFAESNGLQCVYKRGNLRSLILFNRPAILKLTNTQGQSYYVTLLSVDDSNATVQLADDRKTVSLDAIESQWLGDYISLWQPPIDFKNPVRMGYEGPVVQWINQQLTMILGQSILDHHHNVYNREIEQEIIKFQLSEGLVPDGIVGVLTIMRLNSVNDKNVPKLNNSYARS